MDLLDQFPLAITSSTDNPMDSALEDDAALVECALCVLISIPARESISLSHLAIVSTNMYLKVEHNM